MLLSKSAISRAVLLFRSFKYHSVWMEIHIIIKFKLALVCMHFVGLKNAIFCNPSDSLTVNSKIQELNKVYNNLVLSYFQNLSSLLKYLHGNLYERHHHNIKFVLVIIKLNCSF